MKWRSVCSYDPKQDPFVIGGGLFYEIGERTLLLNTQKIHYINFPCHKQNTIYTPIRIKEFKKNKC